MCAPVVQELTYMCGSFLSLVGSIVDWMGGLVGYQDVQSAENANFHRAGFKRCYKRVKKACRLYCRVYWDLRWYNCKSVWDWPCMCTEGAVMAKCGKEGLHRAAENIGTLPRGGSLYSTEERIYTALRREFVQHWGGNLYSTEEGICTLLRREFVQH